MIVIIGAMQIETEGLSARLSRPSKHQIGAVSYTQGFLGEMPVAVSCCGIGKVFSAMTAAVLIEKLSPALVINLGVAGGIKPIERGDIVVGTRAVQHDYSAVADGLPPGQVHGFTSPYFPCDADAAALLVESATRLGYRAVAGTVASGDQFVNDSAKAAEIAQLFNASAIDMETAAIAQVCAVQSVKFAVLRSISDNGDESAVESFYEFVSRAAKRSINTVERFTSLYKLA